MKIFLALMGMKSALVRGIVFVLLLACGGAVSAVRDGQVRSPP
jgi:hypothetical protein